MKKQISFLVLVAHVTSLVAVTDMRINVAANDYGTTKIVTGADAAQLQQAEWAHDAQGVATAKQEQDTWLQTEIQKVNSKFHAAVLTGDWQTVRWALATAKDMATNVNTPINGTNALPLEVALDQIIKTADTYNYLTLQTLTNIGGELGYSVWKNVLPVFASLTTFSCVFEYLLLPDLKDNPLAGVTPMLGKSLVVAAAAAAAMMAPWFIQAVITKAQGGEVTGSTNYWNALCDRLDVARTILNCNAIDLSKPQFNTPQALDAIVFIRTSSYTVAQFKQFVANVKAKKYDSLRLAQPQTTLTK